MWRPRMCIPPAIAIYVPLCAGWRLHGADCNTTRHMPRFYLGNSHLRQRVKQAGWTLIVFTAKASWRVAHAIENEVSKIFVDQDRTGKKTYKFLTVTNKYEEHPADFVKDYEKIKSLALRQKQIKTIELWQEQKIKDTYINVNKDYRDCVFASDWVKK